MSENGCGSGGCSANKEAEEKKMAELMGRIKNKIVVLSGKGGVGKSTVAANLAVGLSLEGYKTGLLDVDVHGPSIPRLLKLTGTRPGVRDQTMVPVEYSWNLGVMSVGFLLPDEHEAVVWRGPVKGSVIKQFLDGVEWGERDYLIVDCPPGTGDEPLSVLQFLGKDAKAVIVTSPQAVAMDDVRRSITFCRLMDTEIIGIVENLSGFVCPDCGATHNIFDTGGGERLALDAGVPFIGRIPIDMEAAKAGDSGEALLAVKNDSPASQAFKHVVKAVIKASV